MRIVIKGTVQGVGFRPTVYRVAKGMGLNGYVKNKGSEVEVMIDGNHEEFLKNLREDLPPLAKITDVEIFNEDHNEKGFRIVPSEEGKRSSTIPVDTALCSDCLNELISPEDRRFAYPFINCTNCGARYSAITGLPYDRPKTTMAPFPLCRSCAQEYEDPLDRRFHAQTTSCPDCGPKYVLFNKEREKIGGIREFSEKIEKGAIGIAKSWGGMHIVCKLSSIPELRRRYGRPEKPFAIMVKDLKTAKRYAQVTGEELFTGPRRPIMIYEKKDEHGDILESVSPGLPTIGIMLPYTGLHHTLFDSMGVDTLVMTSANIPGEPMIIDDKKVFELDLDLFLLHNRRIAQRIDDSLIRAHGEYLAPIRRSRGFVPEYLPIDTHDSVIGAGADQSGCIAFSNDGKLYPSQYLGDLDSYEAVEFYKQTTEHLTSLLGIEEVDTIGVDLHPKYRSRKLGIRLAEKYDAQIVEVQHHWAHGASLLLEHNLDDIVCIAVDGTGYGDDGSSWGGEILYCTPKRYEREAHLESFPLLGGERAVEDPRRSVYAIQRKLGLSGSFFDESEADILDTLMRNSVETSSFGRLLDAVSAALGVCYRRTYEGEPAMKLEKLLMEGKTDRYYNIHHEGNTVYTLNGFIEMIEDGGQAADRAASYISCVAHELAEAAVRAAEERDTEIGISGGVSYNRPIVEWIRKRLKDLGHDLLVHEKIPNGDMGVPIGQAVVAAQFEP